MTHQRTLAPVYTLICVLAITLAVALVPQAAGALRSDPTTTAPAVRAPKPGVVVDGAVRKDGPVTRRALRGFEQQTVVASYTAMGTPVTKTFTGPLLVDVVLSRRPRFDPAVPNDFLRFAVRAVATDGYQAVVAWGEIDPGFEGKDVLLALTEDGEKLERPRLVVPGDARGGRYVTDVETLSVLDLGA